MNASFDTRTLFWRTVSYHRRALCTLALAASLTIMVIGGALFIGDSLREGLVLVGRQRLGAVRQAVSSRERWFQSTVATGLTTGCDGTVAAVISLPAHALQPNTEESIAVSLYGVDEQFFALGLNAPAPPPPLKKRQVWINEFAAQRLGLVAGDEVLISYFEPTAMPGDTALARLPTRRGSGRFTVAAVLGGEQAGSFSMQTSQQPAANVFMARESLAERLGRPGRANLLLTDSDGELFAPLQRVLRLADYGLQLSPCHDGLELRSDRVFIADPVIEAVEAARLAPRKILSAFVNELRVGERTVPYSFVTGMEGPPVVDGLADDGVLVNQWLAERLNCKPGDELTMKAYRLAPMGQLREGSTTVTVHGVIPLAGAALDPGLMPAFPGMEDADSCDDWQPGLPIDLDLVDDDDEAYWDQHRGTPKAFVTLAAAQRWWGNRFGSVTAVRFRGQIRDAAARIEAQLQPAALGFDLRPLLRESRQGISGAVDFSGLFLGLSFFLIIAALLFFSLLVSFYVEQRHRECTLLQILGFEEKWIDRRMAVEGALCLVIAIVPGLAGAACYGALVLRAMASSWQGAVPMVPLFLHIEPRSVAIGVAAAFVALGVALVSTVRRSRSHSKVSLISGESQLATTDDTWALPSALVCLAIACGIVFFAPRTGELLDIALFFCSGFFVLVGTTQLAYWYLAGRSTGPELLSLSSLALRNGMRKPARSRAVIRVIACAVFLILAVSVNRRGLLKDPARRSSGTGGFALYVETALPLVGDLDGLPKGAQLLRLPSSDGTEAGCLNLNRVTNPRLTGIEPDSFTGRFTFKNAIPGAKPDWTVLERQFASSNIIPVVADAEVILWSLGKGLGEEIAFRNSLGQEFQLRFVASIDASIFQGQVLVSKENYYRLFPESVGSRLLLVDVDTNELTVTRKALARSLERLGCHIQTGSQRLAIFNQVQNTYLAIFLVLGGLAMVLGCLGLAVLVRRNIHEREESLRFLRSIGFSRSNVLQLLFLEHGYLFVSGLLCGLLSAALAVVPVIASQAGALPVREMLSFVVLVVFVGVAALATAVPFDERKIPWPNT